MTVLLRMGRVLLALLPVVTGVAAHAGAHADSASAPQTQSAPQTLAEMDRRLNTAQARFETDRSTDEALLDAFAVFSAPQMNAEDSERTLDDWVEQFPRSYAARVARGIHRVQRGLDARGSAFARDTSEAQFAAMRQWISLGKSDLQASLALSRAPLLTHIWLIIADMRMGPREAVERHFRTGAAYAPGNMQLRVHYMTSLEPKWGGSIEAMERFARETETTLGAGRVTDVLWGWVWSERVDPLMDEGHFAKVETLLTPVLARYHARRLYCTRAQARAKLDNLDGAMMDMRAALEGLKAPRYCIRTAVELARARGDVPGMLEVLDLAVANFPDDLYVRRTRAWLLTLRGDRVAARKDLEYAAQMGDTWAMEKLGTPVAPPSPMPATDEDPMLPLIRASARQGVPHAQEALVSKLKALGRVEEARREERIYRVSEEARPRAVSDAEVAVITMGALGYLKDPRVQALILGAVMMLVLVRRTRQDAQGADGS